MIGFILVGSIFLIMIIFGLVGLIHQQEKAKKTNFTNSCSFFDKNTECKYNKNNKGHNNDIGC